MSCRGPLRARPGRAGVVGCRRPADRGPPGRGRPDLAAAPGTRGLRLRPGPPPVRAGRTGKPPGGPPARARVGSSACRARSTGRGVRTLPAARPARLTPAELAQIRALAADIPALWAAPTTTVADRKKLIRAVIERVEVTAEGATESVRATVVWAGGQQTDADLVRPVARVDQLSYYPALAGRIRALAAQGLASTAIAGRSPPRAAATPPGRTLQLRRDPAPDPPPGHPPRPGPRPAHRPRQTRRQPVVALHPRPRDRHAGRHLVQLAQTRLDPRPARHPPALPLDHHRRPRRSRTTPRPAPTPGGLPQPAPLDRHRHPDR